MHNSCLKAKALRFFIGVTFLTILSFASSCRRRPLDIEADSIRIMLDNDYTMPYRQTKEAPYNYSVMMYGRKDGKLIYKDFCGEKGGPIRGVAGEYKTYVYDLDNDVTKFEGLDNKKTMRAYTEEESFPVKATFLSCRYALSHKVNLDGFKLVSVKGSAGFEGDLVIKEPNAVFAGINENVNVPNLALSDEEYIIPVSNDYALSQGRLTFYGVTHTENIASVQVYVTNLARSKYIAEDEPENEPATIPFYCDIINEDYIQGVFNYFGKLKDASLANTAYVIVTDLSGGKYLFVFDVTNQIDEQEDNADVILKLNFDVPSPQTGGTGFQPIVDNWDMVWYDVPIGK